VKKPIETFEAFWPFYLGEHSVSATRWLHFAGSSLAVFCVGMAVVRANLGYLVAALVAGYGFAWFSHFLIERNRPATFSYPLWSFVADWKMWALMLTGRLGPELHRFGIVPKSPEAARH
jgi:hypothetical protein